MPGRKVWLAKPVEADGVTADGKNFRTIDDYKRCSWPTPINSRATSPTS